VLLCPFYHLLEILYALVARQQLQRLTHQPQVYLTQLKYFYLDCAIGSSLVSPVSPEISQCLFRVIDFLEDTYGVQVHPVKFTKMQRAVPLFLAALASDAYGPSFGECLTDNRGKEKTHLISNSII
jgi:hypothetical protein